MKDAQGHGSNSRGEHAAGTEQVGRSPFGDPGVHEWAMSRIAEAEGGRNWSQLPSDFQRDAVKKIFAGLKDHMDKKMVGHRISASKATTFADLRNALAKG